MMLFMNIMQYLNKKEVHTMSNKGGIFGEDCTILFFILLFLLLFYNGGFGYGRTTV